MQALVHYTVRGYPDEVNEWCSENLTGFWQTSYDPGARRHGAERFFITLENNDEEVILFKLRWGSSATRISFISEKPEEPAFTLEEIAPPAADFNETHPAMAMLADDPENVSLYSLGRRPLDAESYPERSQDFVARVIAWCAENLTDYRIEGDFNPMLAIRGDEERALFKLRWLPDVRITSMHGE